MCVRCEVLWLVSHEPRGNSDKGNKMRGAQDREDWCEAHGTRKKAAGCGKARAQFSAGDGSARTGGMTTRARRRREQ
jgi:hypothetical protein